MIGISSSSFLKIALDFRTGSIKILYMYDSVCLNPLILLYLTPNEWDMALSTWYYSCFVKDFLNPIAMLLLLWYFLIIGTGSN